jgi:hypothetical protein
MKKELIEKPTDKQIEFAEAISERLNIDLPLQNTKQSYTAYISYWVKEFYESDPDTLV